MKSILPAILLAALGGGYSGPYYSRPTGSLASRRQAYRDEKARERNHTINAPRHVKRPTKGTFRLRKCPNPFAVTNALFKERHGIA